MNDTKDESAHIQAAWHEAYQTPIKERDINQLSAFVSGNNPHIVAVNLWFELTRPPRPSEHIPSDADIEHDAQIREAVFEINTYRKLFGDCAQELLKRDNDFACVVITSAIEGWLRRTKPYTPHDKPIHDLARNSSIHAARELLSLKLPHWPADLCSQLLNALDDLRIDIKTPSALLTVEKAIFSFQDILSRLLDNTKANALTSETKPASVLPATTAPATAKKVLIGKDSILVCLDQPEGQWRLICELSKKTDGPLKTIEGGKTIAIEADLIAWWDIRIANWGKVDAKDKSRKAVVGGVRNYGRKGKVAPEISGSIKNRANRANR